MRKALSLQIVLLLLSFVHAQQPVARIKIDIDRQIGDVDKLLFGNFTEHLGRCIYGGIYDPKSAQANSQGFRKDVIDATKNLGVSIVRWPGGNFSSGYHWLDGVGPAAQRPKRKDLAWGDTETNLVGTDEFMQFVKAASVEPYFCINLGTGTWDEARNWVEYCNAPAGLYYSDLRVKNGHPEPYHIKYWGLGNEIDGPWQMGHRSAEEYSRFALEAAKLMKWSDDSIKLIASGSSNYTPDWADWNRTVLNTLHDHIEYLSLHHYSGNYEHDHKKFMALNTRVENIITITEGIINEVRSKYHMTKPIYIAFDEYNVWYRAFNEQKLEEHYNLQDVLVVAMYLNTFIRHANIVKMANMAQLVNVIAPMMVTGDKLWTQTIYYPLQLIAANCKGKSLALNLECEKYSAGDFKDVPFLDVSSTYDEKNREIILNVVNRNESAAIETTILNQTGVLSTDASVSEINSSNMMDENSVSAQNVKPVTKEIKVGADRFTYKFPAHSYTMIKLKLKA